MGKRSRCARAVSVPPLQRDSSSFTCDAAAAGGGLAFLRRKCSGGRKRCTRSLSLGLRLTCTRCRTPTCPLQTFGPSTRLWRTGCARCSSRHVAEGAGASACKAAGSRRRPIFIFSLDIVQHDAAGSALLLLDYVNMVVVDQRCAKPKHASSRGRDAAAQRETVSNCTHRHGHRAGMKALGRLRCLPLSSTLNANAA